MEKKLPERLEHIVASFATAQPLRLMFQDEARFGRLRPHRRYALLLGQTTDAPHGASNAHASIHLRLRSR